MNEMISDILVLIGMLIVIGYFAYCAVKHEDPFFYEEEYDDKY